MLSFHLNGILARMNLGLKFSKLSWLIGREFMVHLRSEEFTGLKFLNPHLDDDEFSKLYWFVERKLIVRTVILRQFEFKNSLVQAETFCDNWPNSRNNMLGIIC